MRMEINAILIILWYDPASREAETLTTKPTQSIIIIICSNQDL